MGLINLGVAKSSHSLLILIMKRNDFIFCLALIAMVVIVRAVLLRQLFNVIELGSHAQFLKKIIGASVVIAVCIFIAKKRGLLVPGGFTQPNSKNYFLLIIPVLFPGLLFVSGMEFYCLNNAGFAILVLFSIFMPALMEEVVFRGVMQGYLIQQKQRLSANTICIIVASLFALVHLFNLKYGETIGVLQQVIAAFYIGLLLCVLMFRTNSVWMLGLTHTILNLFSFRCRKVMTVTNDPLENSFSSSGADLTDVLIPIILLSPILIAYWFLLRGIKKAKSPGSEV